jgi:hypothetical protein
MLGDFFEFADLSGLPLPEDSQHLRQLLDKSLLIDEQHIEGWPRKEFLSLLALGQHYGLPTRLLDWTRNSYIAAYFAAKEAARKQKEGGTDFAASHLSVWAFNKFKGDLYWRWRDGQPRLIEIVAAPAAGNPNLYAQKGLFTHVRSNLKGEIDRRPLDEILLSLPDAYELFHFTLPIAQASDLLGLLSNYQINGATVYPGYAGAAKAVA